MATTKAIIRQSKVNSKGECVVYIRYGHQQKSVDLSTKMKVPVKGWNEKKELVNSSSTLSRTKANLELIENLKNADLRLNTKIEAFKSEVIAIARDFQIKNIEPEVDKVKAKYLEKHQPRQLTKDKAELVELYDEFIKNSNKSIGTKKNYKSTLGHFKKYEEARNRKVTVGDVSLNLYDDLTTFLYEEIEKPDGSIGLADNTVGTSIKNLKTLLTYLQKRGYPVPPVVSEFKVTKIAPPIYFLSEDELKLLSEKEFESERLTRVRDLFVFNCYTGLRFSDLERFKKHHIVDGVIQLRAFKNQKDVYVPLTPKSEEILKRYDWELPKISEQRYNEYIKEACKIAEIDQDVELIKTAAGNKTYKRVPKHKVITSHTAVKTFISLCGKKGISPKIVSEITGKSVQVILKHYYGIDKDTIKSQMKQAFQ